MLVIHRKIGQRVFLGPDCSVMPLDQKGRSIRLGIDAPANVRVLREELGIPPRLDSGDPACRRIFLSLSAPEAYVVLQALEAKLDREGVAPITNAIYEHLKSLYRAEPIR